MYAMGVAVESRAISGTGRVLTGLLCGAAIVVLDFFIVLACLPTIEQDLHASKAQLQLILAVYAVANGSFLVVGGRLGDVYGRHRVLLWGLGAFANASLACGLSTSPVMLIALRAVQGLAGALIQPQVLGLLTVNFAPADRPRVMSLYAASMGCAGIGAQLLGGLFVGLFDADLGWRLCFMLSVPLCLAAMVFMISAAEGPRTQGAKVDAVGASLVAVALGCLCTCLTMGREQGWPRWTVVVLAVGVLGALALVGWLRHGYATNADRIVPAGILSENKFWMALGRIFLFYGGVASLYFVLALELRVSHAYSALQVGLFFGWLAVCFVSASMSKRFRALVGPRWAEIGAATMFAGHLVMLVAGSRLAGAGQVVAFLLSCGLQGTGIGCLIGPLMAEALSKVRPDRASVGGGIASATQQVGNSLGVAAIGFFYFSAAHPGGDAAGAVAYLCALTLALGVVALRGRRAAAAPA